MKTKKVIILAFEFCSLYCYYYKHLGHVPLMPPPHKNYYRLKSNYTPKERHSIPQPAASCIFRTFFSLTCEQTAGERGSGNKGKGFHTYGFKRNHQITSAQGPLSTCSDAFCRASLNHPQQTGSHTAAESWKLVYFENLPLVRQ